MANTTDQALTLANTAAAAKKIAAELEALAESINEINDNAYTFTEITAAEIDEMF